MPTNPPDPESVAAEIIQKMADQRRSWIENCARTLELLQPEWERFEKRDGHNVYVARLYADHTSELRTHKKELAALEAALAALQSKETK